MIRWRLSKHARAEIIRRRLPFDMVVRTIISPQQIVPEKGGLRAYQRVLRLPAGRVTLLRVIVDDSIEPLVVITAYRTSKVHKYWREDEDPL